MERRHFFALVTIALSCGTPMLAMSAEQGDSSNPSTIVDGLRDRFDKLKKMRKDFSESAAMFTGDIKSRDAAVGSRFDSLVAQFRDLITYTSTTGEFSQVSQQVIDAIDKRILDAQSKNLPESSVKKLKDQKEAFIRASNQTLSLNSMLEQKLKELLVHEQQIRKAIRDSISADDLTGMVNQMNKLIEEILLESDKLIQAVTQPGV